MILLWQIKLFFFYLNISRKSLNIKWCHFSKTWHFEMVQSFLKKIRYGHIHELQKISNRKNSDKEFADKRFQCFFMKFHAIYSQFRTSRKNCFHSTTYCITFKMSPILKIYKVVVKCYCAYNLNIFKRVLIRSLCFWDGGNPHHLESFYNHLVIVLHLIIKTYQPTGM